MNDMNAQDATDLAQREYSTSSLVRNVMGQGIL
jgi:hypothetical protein